MHLAVNQSSLLVTINAARWASEKKHTKANTNMNKTIRDLKRVKAAAAT